MKEKILEPNNDRFVIFPIEHNDIWEFYKQHQAAFWTAEEVDLSNDIRDWENLSDNEKFFVKNVLMNVKFFHRDFTRLCRGQVQLRPTQHLYPTAVRLPT